MNPSRSFATHINKQSILQKKTKHKIILKTNKYKIKLIISEENIAFKSSIWFVTKLESTKINQTDSTILTDHAEFEKSTSSFKLNISFSPLFQDYK